MMHRLAALIGLALSLAAVPTASAQENEYLGPEEVFYQQSPALYQIPRGRRAAEANAARQSGERQARFYGSSSSAAAATASADETSTNLHSAAPDADDDEFDIEYGGGIVIEGTSQEALDWLGNSMTLHSGADENAAAQNALPGTGPAVILVGIVLACAGGWTLWRARRMSQNMGS